MGLAGVGASALVAMVAVGGLLVLPSEFSRSAPAALSDDEALSARPTDVVWNGRLAYALCIPTGLMSCVGTTSDDSDDLHLVDLPKDASRVGATVSWDPSSETTRTLRFSIAAATVRPCDGCVSYRFRTLARVDGVSPQRLDVSLDELQPGEKIALIVGAENTAPSPLYGEARLPQPFAVAARFSD